jgi:signal peptidase I
VAPRLGWDRWIIKRVAALPGDTVPGAMREAADGAVTVPEQNLLVSADNPSGTDSRQWGFIPASDVLGPVLKKLDLWQGRETTTQTHPSTDFAGTSSG